ncbi:hypothetical protein Tco_1512635, partial [Tanacetum coccineum]
TDIEKITRKRSKPYKHEHGNEKSAQEPEVSSKRMTRGAQKKHIKRWEFTLKASQKKHKECHTGNPCDNIFDLTAKTGYPIIERIQGQRSNPRGACEEDLEAVTPPNGA